MSVVRLEKDIQKDILKYLKTIPGIFFYKAQGGAFGKNGIPDIIVCLDGRFLGIEVKRPGGRLSRLQEHVGMQIRHARGGHLVATSCEEVREFITNGWGEHEDS